MILSVGANTHLSSSSLATPRFAASRRRRRRRVVCVVVYKGARRQFLFEYFSLLITLIPFLHTYVHYIGTFETPLQGSHSHSTTIIFIDKGIMSVIECRD